VNGVSNVGGLVGYNYFGGVSNCYSTGDVNGGEHVGGLAGYNLYGNVLNCYSTGDVSGDDDVGGLVGYDYYGSVSNCFWEMSAAWWGMIIMAVYQTVSGIPTTRRTA
jgi:hypothetical protein